MTTQAYIAKIRSKLEGLKQNNKPLAIAVANTHAHQMGRIFIDGKASNGTNIGSYNSTKPLYVNPLTAPKKFAKKGMSGKTKFKNGKPHKTGYFSSYKDFRAALDRPTSFVNLNLSSQLVKDISNSLTKVSANKYVTGTKNKHNSNKLEGAEDKYGKVFSLTKSEREKFKKVLQAEVYRALK